MRFAQRLASYCFKFLLLVRAIQSFGNTSLLFSLNELKTAIDITVGFTTEWAIALDEVIIIQLPRFTRALSGLCQGHHCDLPFGSVILTPSTLFAGAWTEGDVLTASNSSSASGTSFSPGYLSLRLRSTASTDIVVDRFVRAQEMISVREEVGVLAGTPIEVTVSALTGIGAWCGFPDSHMYFNSSEAIRETLLPTPFSLSSNNSAAASKLKVGLVQHYKALGSGCDQWNWCHGHGLCDFCRQRCECESGYGSASDQLLAGAAALRLDCSERACPSGPSLYPEVTPLGASAHSIAECSGVGVCDRATGLCACPPPFTGPSCSRVGCPNDCSARGSCVGISELATLRESLNGSATRPVTSSDTAVHICLCESAWPVGYGAGQRQLAQYFGPDCSLKRCPSGNDPFTPLDEEDCRGLRQSGVLAYGLEVGEEGNLCHVDCANRGICDHHTGLCSCFPGSRGENCADLVMGT